MYRIKSNRKILLICLTVFVSSICHGQETIDLRKFDSKGWNNRFVAQDATENGLEQELKLPPIENVEPAAGKRVLVTPVEYAQTQVHHAIYLPSDWNNEWKAEKVRYPVIVELTGNYFPKSGSTGKIEDAGLGFGISKGHFIWVTMPFVSHDLISNAVTWWGDEAATVAYIKQNLPRICESFGGDPNAVFLCGFSRGAIGVNYIGLYDEEISRLWCGFITHDHFDGVKEWKGTTWGSPLPDYREAAKRRLGRLRGQPYLVCQNGSTSVTKEYLKPNVSLENFTFLNVDTPKILGAFPNDVAVHPHTDRWLLKDSSERRVVWKWVYEVMKK